MISEQYLCFAACLQIAAKETANVEIDQVIFANHLGVVLPVGFDGSALAERGVTNIRFDSDSTQWGIVPVVPKINAVLKSFNPSLECRFETISKFQDWEFEDQLSALRACGQFPIVGFDYYSLADEPAVESRGHCAVVYRVYNRTGHLLVEICDPGPKHAGVREVDAYSLYRACRKGHGGIWSLSFSRLLS
jgi:hypothetical protein